MSIEAVRRARKARSAAAPAAASAAGKTGTAGAGSGERLREMVAWACRILAMHGQGDLTLGHASAREGERIYMKRKGIGLEEVTAGDLLTLDAGGQKVSGSGRVHLEAPLHTEVYRARPDVGAVIHTHPLYAIAFGATDARLEYLSHDALLFAEGIAVYEDSADLVVTPESAQAIAASLGPRRALLLRNHGALVVGRDVRWAVLAALTLERAFQIQAAASGLGTRRPIGDALIPALHASKYREEFLDEYWAYWVRGVRRAGLDTGMPGGRAGRAPSSAS